MSVAAVERWDLAPDLSISRIVTGLWQIADMERDGRELDLEATAEAMQPYVDVGLTTFDMADHYGSAELIAGIYGTGHPGAVERFTKWVPEPGRSSRGVVREAVERSLERLQTDSLELLQFHAWNYADPSYLDTLFRLQELKEEGLIRHLGMTNTDTAHLRMMVNSGIEIASNQICFSLLDQRARANGMTEFCAAHGITLLAFGCLGGGFLSERWLGKPEPDWGDGLETWSEMKYGRFIREAGGWEALQGVLRAANAAAERHGVSLANVACRYILDQPAVGGVIVGARLGIAEHIEDNLRIFELELDDVDRAEIDGALAALTPIPGDCGDEYRRPPFLTASGDLSHHLETMPAAYEPVTGDDGCTRVSSGTIWEEMAGFSRAVRIGDRILVSGTTATHERRVIGGDDPVSQTHFAIDKIEGAIQSLGGALADVVRTRVYVREHEHAEAISRVHGARFGDIRPANTLVQTGLVGDDYLVEIEAEAIVDGG